MPLTQTALVVSEIGKPVVLRHDHPVPEPGPKQVQLKVTVAGINPHDQKNRDNGIFIAGDLPGVLCNDVVGIVAALGENVTEFALGDRVVSQAGLYKRSVQNDVGAAARIPDSITDDEAATLPTNVIAPLVAFFSELQIPAPWSSGAEGFDYANAMLLVIGGGSNCGRFGVQLAKLVGIGKIVVVGGDETELKSFGATHVIDRHAGEDAILGHIKDVVGDDLVYAFDAVNPPAGQSLAIDALSSQRRGSLARLLSRGTIDESLVHQKEAGYNLRDVLGISQLHPDMATEFWTRLPAYLEDGSIKPLGFVVSHGLDADHVNEVLDRYRDGHAVTKTHVHL
ncbi:hypothetical protein LTR36_003484 [Oleoguttula mirabilis]|uniref:Enoyl reductase (ER) domain-containing protein n=1 Tax=Oleoguttula mirabilis TaxID=1507867 RepID=A0AAV9JJJ4_9PEZI|nr:hypothetical protein LTR36_003484 [Oleoguttula mirabilis]